MERARHRKSRSASGIEGIQQMQKQKGVSRLSTDACSHIDGTNRLDLFMLELGQSSIGRPTGIPMKKLLAEEMSKEVEPKRRSPSLIAKLMGLEGLPSPRHVHRQPKTFSDSYQQKNVSTKTQLNNQIYDGRSSRRSTMDQQEFKDVYEDLEASHVVNRRCSSRWNTSSMLTEPEMEFIQQKFINAKRLSTDEKLQDSKELDDTLEMLDSNKDLLLKFLHRPDSLCVKHLHELQVDPEISLGRHIAVSKPSKSEKYEAKSKTWRSKKDTSTKHNVTYHVKREDGLLLEPQSRHRAHISRKSSRIQLEEKNEDKVLPTRIVVLKPNLAKMQNAGLSNSLHNLPNGCQCNFKKMKEHSNVGIAETVTLRRRDSSHSVGFPKPMSKEAKEIARDITRRMRAANDETVDVTSIGFRGYAGDESSYDANESDSESESEMFKFSSRKSFDDNTLRRYPSPSLGESSVSREAKKRLSERWRMTHKYQDLKMVNKSSTLGEMLALPDRETRPENSNAKTCISRANNQSGSNNGTAMQEFPLGISSRDGWKDEMNRKSRSTSLPPSIGGRSHRRSTFRDELAEDKHPTNSNAKHTGRCGRSKAVKGNPSHKEDLSSKNSKSLIKKPHACQRIFNNEIGSSSEANFEIQMEANTKDLSEQQPMLQMIPIDDHCKSPVDIMVIDEHRSTALCPESPELLQKQSSSVLDDDISAIHDQEDSSHQKLQSEQPEQGSPSLHHPGTELDSPESSKEAHHPSPVSVLEVPHTEAASSSESFERVSAELQELRMQLRLLKMESGTYSDISSVTPNDEDVTHLSPIHSEGNYSLEPERWETSYTLDVLIDSGLEESDFDIFRSKWHSPNCPLDPNLFENLEKNYETNGSRLERRLLFDRINAAIFDIFEEKVDLCPWIMPKLAGFSLSWQKEGVIDALERLISQDFVKGEISDSICDREMQGSGSKAEIEVICVEIENLLIDDMITEVIYM